MKKITAIVLILTLLLSGCGTGKTPETTAPTELPTEAPTTAPTTVPTEPPTEPPVLRNPLNGQVVDEPLTNRVFAFSIGNTKESLPHYGISRADVVFESFVNGLTTRRFAMFSNVQDVASIGGSRSMRIQFTDLAEGYDAVALYAGGSSYVIGDLNMSGIDGIISEQWGGDFFYRDKDRIGSGIGYEHSLFDRGDEVVAYAESQGIRVTQDAEHDYGMRFSETPSVAEGEEAGFVTVSMVLSSRIKDSLFTYDPQLQGYTMSQYGVKMMDGFYSVPEVYRNVFVLYVENHTEDGIYHVAETVGQGEGLFACDGRIVPILWHREDNASPFTFTLTDGTPLEQGVGASYISLAPIGSTTTWSAEAPAEVEESMPPMPEVQPTTGREPEETEPVTQAAEPSEQTAVPGETPTEDAAG